ncbi:glycerate kinase [Anaerobacterium chartisolvens]|uniref:Glycerate kinase n=1 Tax=Anaerobacterium chartisolvens TaxID=1297424 RepID=A0A369B9J5_9FIRM|nr:glycerate kinase [Anaerobacterium chartisolvens]RCX16354.1 glycerate kinase [Anaerobacterium chartisolvens]
MKIVFAPDSFKGSLSSLEIIDVLNESARRIFEDVATVPVPMADGGEGTIDALIVPAGGTKETVTVTGPMGNPVEAVIGYIHEGKTAVLEMAQASGLFLVPGGKKNPLAATSYGTGELIRRVLDKGIRSIIIGIGGSATNDGGMGAMRALGVRFLDAEGKELEGRGSDLELVRSIDASGLNPAASECSITVICDVSNPLLGKDGATYIYGPQKGVTPDLLDRLDRGMAGYIKVVEGNLNKEIANAPGAGAAGGMGAALMAFLGAELKPGIDVVLDAVGFDGLIDDASFVVTGEGNIDEQSVRFGKVPTGIMKRCTPKKVPVAVISGGMGKGAELFWRDNLGSIMTTVNGIMTLDTAIANSKELLRSGADRMFLLIKIGMGIK